MADRIVILRRTVRFAINDPAAATPSLPAALPAAQNGYAGVPPMRGLGRHYELDVGCLGRVDPLTGYFVNIKEIDAAVRAQAIGTIAHACHTTPSALPQQVIRAFWPALDASLRHAAGDGPTSAAPAPPAPGPAGSLESVRWHLTPTYSVEMTRSEPQTALIRQRFEFAASHRLHAAGLSDEENRRCFGKCNHPSGHGHNYIVEPCVAVPVGDSGSPALDLPALEAIVLREVVDRFDHKHLNTDVPEFSSPSGLNPSVENIAKVCYDRLLAPIAAAGAAGRTGAGGGATLRSVTVWETEKTSCTFPA